MRKVRRQFSNAEKVSIIRRHLLDREPVSKLCEELEIAPPVFYTWQKQFFENGEAAFSSQRQPKSDGLQRKVESLEAKLQVKNEVLSELMEEHVLLKKGLGAG